jgi:hypothetical protein
LGCSVFKGFVLISVRRLYAFLLVETMKSLLWKRVCDTTSPNQVLEASGLGKGSLYHHFKSKKSLAVAAMESRADEAIKEADLIFSG